MTNYEDLHGDEQMMLDDAMHQQHLDSLDDERRLAQWIVDIELDEIAQAFIGCPFDLIDEVLGDDEMVTACRADILAIHAKQYSS